MMDGVLPATMVDRVHDDRMEQNVGPLQVLDDLTVVLATRSYIKSY